MRNISEQELKEILIKHEEWLSDSSTGERADLSSANLSYADLRGADLRSANLRGADLSSANPSYADLRGANLRSADLRSANLCGANLRGADLRSADLRGADLSSANLMLFQFQKHQAFYTLDGTLRIGCLVMPISEWLLGFEEIGKKEGYTFRQIKAYVGFIKTCADMLKAEGEGEL